MTRSSVTGSAPVGKYTLEVGPYAGSSAQFASTPSRADKAQARQNAAVLRSALAESEQPREPDTPLEAVEKLEATADGVTDRVEHANKLFKAVAADRLFDPKLLTGEIGALLGLLERLDREGRYDEEIRIAKALHGLCVLAFRWLDLLRSLRSALRAARAAGDEAAQAWALNELGALHLCAGDSRKAEQYLEHALELQDKLGDAAGRCATRHNLDSARRDIARPVQLGVPRRLTALGGVVGALQTRFLGVKSLAIFTLLLVTPAAVGWFAGGGDGPVERSNPTRTIPTQPEPGGGPSAGALDVALRNPGRYLRGGERLEATASDKDKGGGHVRSVAFQWASADGGDWSVIAGDRRPPYQARLRTRTLPDGAYSLRVVAKDMEGKLYPSAPVAVVIDNTPPTARIVGDGFLRGDVEIEVAASDALSGVDRTQVQYAERGHHTWAPVLSSWATTELEDGPYDLRIRATDRAGNGMTSKVVTRWVDNHDPAVEITAPTDFVNASDGYGGAYTVTATAPARDVEQVEFFRCDDESEDCSSEAWVSLGIDKASPYQASWKLDSDGNRALRAVVTDRASREASHVVNVLIDRHAPVRGAASARLVWDPEAVTYRIDLKIRKARDFGSGVASGSELVKRAQGVWIVGVVGYCALATDFLTLANVPPTDLLSDYKVERGRCYVYLYEVADKAGNVARFRSNAVLVPVPLG